MLTADNYPTVRLLVRNYLSQVASPAPSANVANYVAQYWPPPLGPLDDPDRDMTNDVVAAMLLMLDEEPPLIEVANVTMIVDPPTPLADTTTWRLTPAGRERTRYP